MTASAMMRSGWVFWAMASPSSAERALASVKSSAPANVMAKAFWIVTLSSAIKIRLAMLFLDIIIVQTRQLTGQFAHERPFSFLLEA